MAKQPPQNFQRGDPFVQAVTLHQAGRIEEALVAYDHAIAWQPKNFAIHANRGVALLAVGRPQDALASFDRAITLKRDDAISHNNRGNALRALKRPADALGSYERALQLMPGAALLHVNHGTALLDLKRYDEANASFDRAIGIDPRNAMAHNGRGSALLQGNAPPLKALAYFDRALSLDPNLGDAFYNRAKAKQKLGKLLEALEDYDKALSFISHQYEVHNNRGSALAALRRMNEALASLERASAINPKAIEPHMNRGSLFLSAGRSEEALASYTSALALNENSAEAHLGCAAAFIWLGRFSEAVASASRAHDLGETAGLGIRLFASMSLCDWSRFQSDCLAVTQQVVQSEDQFVPFYLMPAIDDPNLQRRIAERFVAHQHGKLSRESRTSSSTDRIRIGYASADFRTHAVMQLFIETLELHDKSKFEIFGFSTGPRSGDVYRRRAEAACSELIDIDYMSEEEATDLVRSKGIDIAIDLTGFTRFSRLGIFARGAAPLQVNFLGYAGTLGAPFIDYVIADPIVIDAANRDGFSEHIVKLPDSFLPSVKIGSFIPGPANRGAHGLPDDAFVFASLNNHHKITPAVFDVWMNILKKVDNSVLWIRCRSDETRANLQSEARQRGVSPQRLVFAGHVSDEEYLGRFALADLFLDTAPYNAHTTASDALRCGLPVLTCSGATFASRVAKSLVTAVGLSELAVASWQDYEQAAVRLARDPEALAALRRKLAHNLPTAPLFNAERYTRHLERAFELMVARHRNGLPPVDIDVAPIG